MAYSLYLKWTSECVYILVVPLPESSSRPLGLWTQVSIHVQYIVSNIDLVFGLSVLDPCVSYCPSGICRCWPCEPNADIRIFLPLYISSPCARRAVVSATCVVQLPRAPRYDRRLGNCWETSRDDGSSRDLGCRASDPRTTRD